MIKQSSDVSLLIPVENHRLYRSRFYVLGVFSFLAFNQCLFWLTFSPISQNTQRFYKISESSVNLLLNWGPIIFIPCLPLAYLLLNQQHGLRKSVIILAVADFIATFVRILPLVLLSPLESSSWISTCCIHLGQIINAACGPLVMAPVSQLSCLWFGPNERTRATTLAIMANNFGSTMGFLISPSIVQKPDDISTLLYLHFFLACSACILALAYFPSEPPTPPSPAAQSLIHQATNNQDDNSLENYMKNIRTCFMTPSFVHLCSIGGLLGGAFAAWTSLFANILAEENFTERQSGWFGFSASLAAIFGGLFSSTIADTPRFRRSFKTLIKFTLIGCFTALLWFQLSVKSIFYDQPLIAPSFTSISLSIIFAGLFQGCALPLVYEALAEIMFPLPESVSASVLVQFVNITALILIFIPPTLYRLMNFLVILAVSICIFLASMIEIDYRRRNEDERRQ